MIVNKAGRNVVKRPTKSARKHVTPFHTSRKMFPGKMSVVFFDHCTDVTGKFVAFLKTSMSHKRTKINSLSQILSYMRKHGYV